MKKNNALFFVLTIFLIFISIKIALAFPDSDRDGVPDANDKCPGTTALIVDSNGCSCSQKTGCTQPWCCPSLNNPCRKDCDDSGYEAICGRPVDYAPCGSARACPQDKCEGGFLVDYPESGHDYCLNGECVAYSCALLSRTAECILNGNKNNGGKTSQGNNLAGSVNNPENLSNITNLTNTTNLTNAAIGESSGELENITEVNLSKQSNASKGIGFPFIPSGGERDAAAPIKINFDIRMIIIGFISIAVLIAIISAILLIARQIAISEAASIEMDLKLRKYILAALAAGFTIDQIRRRLKLSKIPDKHINRAMKGIRLKR